MARPRFSDGKPHRGPRQRAVEKAERFRHVQLPGRGRSRRACGPTPQRDASVPWGAACLITPWCA